MSRFSNRLPRNSELHYARPHKSLLDSLGRFGCYRSIGPAAGIHTLISRAIAYRTGRHPYLPIVVVDRRHPRPAADSAGIQGR